MILIALWRSIDPTDAYLPKGKAERVESIGCLPDRGVMDNGENIFSFRDAINTTILTLFDSDSKSKN